MHVIARVNLGGTARWVETLTADQISVGDNVLVATGHGHVQGDEVEDPLSALMPLVRLGRAVSPLDDLWAVRELRRQTSAGTMKGATEMMGKTYIR
jgi:hypothetical protein